MKNRTGKIAPPAQLRAELDACYACLYGLTRDELRYTPCGVDPKEVYGEDPSTGSGRRFSGETFRVLKEKEVKQFGEAGVGTRHPARESGRVTPIPSFPQIRSADLGEGEGDSR